MLAVAKLTIRQYLLEFTNWIIGILNGATLCASAWALDAIMQRPHVPSKGTDTMPISTGRLFWLVLFVPVTVLLIAGCAAGDPDVEGFWKGQMEPTAADGLVAYSSSHGNDQPRRVLLRLEEENGVVKGVFAQSSDAVNFRRLGASGAGDIATYPVSGTLVGPDIRVSTISAEGLVVQVNATVGESSISGTYTLTAESEDASTPAATRRGLFEVERY